MTRILADAGQDLIHRLNQPIVILLVVRHGQQRRDMGPMLDGFPDAGTHCLTPSICPCRIRRDP
jgi:hypothetical protein